jgi:hypothetical protein
VKAQHQHNQYAEARGFDRQSIAGKQEQRYCSKQQYSNAMCIRSNSLQRALTEG